MMGVKAKSILKAQFQHSKHSKNIFLIQNQKSKNETQKLIQRFEEGLKIKQGVFLYELDLLYETMIQNQSKINQKMSIYNIESILRELLISNTTQQKIIYIKNFQTIDLFLDQDLIQKIYSLLFEEIELLKQTVFYIDINVDFLNEPQAMYVFTQRAYAIYDFQNLNKNTYFDFFLQNEAKVAQISCLQIKPVGEEFTFILFDFEKLNPQDQNPDEVIGTTFRLGITQEEKVLKHKAHGCCTQDTDSQSDEDAFSYSDEELEDYDDHF